jgi:hypothetical protein
MARPERQQAVLDILSDLKGLEPLKQLFWSELSYQRVNQPLSRRGWTEKCLEARGQGAGVAGWEGEINERVARLYGLTAEEIKIVEESVQKP